MRLFVGIGVPETLANRLAIFQSGLPGARWVDPANMHVTLRFIGEVQRGGQVIAHPCSFSRFDPQCLAGQKLSMYLVVGGRMQRTKEGGTPAR